MHACESARRRHVPGRRRLSRCVVDADVGQVQLRLGVFVVQVVVDAAFHRSSQRATAQTITLHRRVDQHRGDDRQDGYE